MANSSGDKHSCEGTMVQFPCPKNGGLPTWHNPKTVKNGKWKCTKCGGNHS